MTKITLVMMMMITLTPQTHAHTPTGWQQQGLLENHGELEVSVGGGETEARVDKLTPATQYLFTLYAHNAMGPSKPSEVRFPAGEVIISICF